MAPQTRIQRQAAAKKAAATRKRNSANSTARATSKQAARSTARRVSAEKLRVEALARRAQRVVLIPVGAALEARDRIASVVRTYSDRQRARRKLNRFERRGASALRLARN